MIPIRIKQAAQAAGGKLTRETDASVSGVSIDSRTLKKGDLFFALKGSATDGHRFLKEAAEKGAAALVVNRHDEQTDAVQIIVEDTFKAMQQFAKAYISQFDIPFAAVTGSSGKTTTKDILAEVLQSKYRTMKTPGNLNSSTGALLTLFELDSSHEAAAVELSMSSAGEILGNAEIIRPQCALITNIGTAHLEFLGSREAIFKAKCEIFTYFGKDSLLVINNDDDMLASLQSETFRIVRTGINSGEIKAENISFGPQGSSFSTQISGKIYNFTFPLAGLHFISDCLLVIGAALNFGLTPEQIQEGFSRYVPGFNRMQTAETGGVLLINDTYNANPDSMKASVDSLCLMAEGRKIAVLGDMLELGESAASLTEQVGKYTAEKGIDILFAAGSNAESLISGFRSAAGGAQAECFDSREALEERLTGVIREGDTVLFKASRAMQLEEIFNAVRESIQ